MIQPAESRDPSELMRDMEPGSVIYAFSAEEDLMIEFLIREASPTIAALPQEAAINIRSGALWHDGVLVVIVLMAIDPDQAIYPTFWNFWHPMENPGDGNIFQHMAVAPELVVKWFGDSGKVERLMAVANPLREFFTSCMRETGKAPAWGIEAFEEAIASVLENTDGFPALWKQL